VQLSRSADGGLYFSVARTLRSDRGGYQVRHPVQAIELGCELRYARQMIYSDGVDLENPDAAVPVGVTCRLCDQMDCEQRVFPSLRHPMRIDENLRGLSFYAPVSTTAEHLHRVTSGPGHRSAKSR
jgi:predicted transcriptional regulator